MEILKYYDDDTIEEEAVFFSNKKIIFFTIVLLLLAIFSWLSLDLVKELTSKLIIVLYACFVVINSVLFLICMTIIILRCEANEEYYSKHELTVAKEKYEHKRKKILEQHKYNFSIFCKEWNEEYLVDSFYVNLDGIAFIKNCDSDYCLKNDSKEIYYHHIIDNRDEHILTVKELKEKCEMTIEEKAIKYANDKADKGNYDYAVGDNVYFCISSLERAYIDGSKEN